MADPNNPTGSAGLIAIDKRGWHALFLDPHTYAASASIELPRRPHEVAISPDHRRAYVSIYGLGVYGDNPRPDHSIMVLDVASKAICGTIDVAPYLAPHGLMLGHDGLLYASCDQSAVVVVIEDDVLVGAIEAGSDGPHQIVMLPDGTRLYVENEQYPWISVLDVSKRCLQRTIELPGGSAGICCTADGKAVLVVAEREPVLTVLDTASDTPVTRIALQGHSEPAQRVRCSPNGQYTVVTSFEAPLVTLFDAQLENQVALQVADGPMGVGFAPDGRTALIGNHGAGRITVIDLEAGRVTDTFAAGVGVETLAFY
ncbi:MAG TPA: hypothetical protein VGL99_23515 [Chloroflexota bacterium]